MAMSGDFLLFVIGTSLLIHHSGFLIRHFLAESGLLDLTEGNIWNIIKCSTLFYCNRSSWVLFLIRPRKCGTSFRLVVKSANIHFLFNWFYKWQIQKIYHEVACWYWGLFTEQPWYALSVIRWLAWSPGPKSVF